MYVYYATYDIIMQMYELEQQPPKNPEAVGTTRPDRDFEIRWYDAWAQFCKDRWGKPDVPGEEREKFVPMTAAEGWAKFCRERWGNKLEDTSQE